MTDQKTAIPVAVDPATGAIITEGGSSGSGSTIITDGTTTSIKATVLGLLDSNPQTVAIVNANGDQITSFGGGTQYTNGQAVASGSVVGSAALGYDGTDLRVMKTDSSGDGYTIITDGTNIANVIPSSTAPSVSSNSVAVAISPNNTGLPVNLPRIVQKTNAISTGSVSSLTATFVSNVSVGNTIIVVSGLGNTTQPTVSDSLNNTYAQTQGISQGTIRADNFYAFVTTGGSNTVTVTNGGAATSMAVEIYEVSGLVQAVSAQPAAILNSAGVGTGTTGGNTYSTAIIDTFIVWGCSVQTAVTTITPPAGFTNDSGNLNPTTPSSLFSFNSSSELYGAKASARNLGGTLSQSENYATAATIFAPVQLNVNISSIPTTAVSQSGTWTVGSNSPTGSGVPSSAFYMGVQTGSATLNGVNSVANGADAQSGTGAVTTGLVTYNGTTFDRQRQANAASNTTGTGLLGVGNLGYDGTNWQAIGSPLQTATTANTAQGMMLTGSGVQSQTFSVTSVTAGTAYDVGNFASVKVQITGQYTGTTPTIAFQTSNDGTNWFVQAIYQSTTNSAPVSSTTSTGIFYGPLAGRYFRLNFTGTYASGTAAGLILFSTAQTSPGTLSTSAIGTTSINSSTATGSAVPANGFYLAGSLGGTLTGLTMTSGTSDNVSTSSYLYTTANQFNYNGNNYDRVRNNTTGVVVAAATTATSSTTITTYNARSAVVIINVSAYTSGTMNVAINLLSSSGYSYSPFTSITGLAATGTVVYRIGPGLTGVAGLTANDVLARSLQIVTSGTFSATYGIDVNLSI